MHVNKAMCEARASPKERWLLCPARGGRALRVEALGKVPFFAAALAGSKLSLCPYWASKKNERHKQSHLRLSKNP